MAALDKLSIDTPEQVALDFSLASIGSRFLALAIDTLIQAGVTLVLVGVAIIAARLIGTRIETLNPWILAALIVGWFFVYSGYFAVFEAVWNGQTPGKRVIGLRVISVTGRPVSVFEAILRNVVRIADQLPGLYAFGIVSIFFTERNQRLGDLAAGTVVVHERAVEAEGMESPEPRAVLTRYGAAQLSAEEIAVVELFLRRRSQLANFSRSRKAAQIAERMRQRLGVPTGTNNEEFLEEIMAEYRAGSRYR